MAGSRAEITIVDGGPRDGLSAVSGQVSTKEISLLDSTGMADPKQVKEILGELPGLNLSVNLAVHFHDTRGTGLVNSVAAYEAGVRIFDYCDWWNEWNAFRRP